MAIYFTEKLLNLLENVGSNLAEAGRIRSCGIEAWRRDAFVGEDISSPLCGSLCLPGNRGWCDGDLEIAIVTNIKLHRFPYPHWMRSMGDREDEQFWYLLEDFEEIWEGFALVVGLILHGAKTGGGDDNPVLATEGETLQIAAAP